MPQPIYKRGRNFVDVAPVSIHFVLLQHSNDFIVGLPAVNHAQSSDGNRLYQDVAMGYFAFGQHTDIERIVVAHDAGSPGLFHAKFADIFFAIRLGNKSIQGRYNIGKFLWAIYFQIAAWFVHFVFYGI